MIGLLFDVRPPTATDGSVSLVLLAIVIAALAVALLLGFVVLLKFLKKRRSNLIISPTPQSQTPYNQP